MTNNKKTSKEIQAERRVSIAPLFFTVLMGIAYDRMIEVASKSFSSGGLTLDNILLVSTFLLISMRFFIGNQLYLISEGFNNLSSLAWIYDFLIITLESICIVFLGSLSSVDVNQNTSLGFVQFMLILYVVDVFWLLSLVFLRKLFRRQLNSIPLSWFVLNLFLFILIIILNYLINDLYSTVGLAWLVVLNLIGFILDVVIIDYSDLL
ncbi:hypothetical protein [Microcystis aeruginosa]|uniref:Integral membrane protein n=1 Tax=Microcystis aeruginosa PCC 9717 TaxID=1160286 RepID=I4FUC0_MICAE|nr:hypothetical protein [Microcystis aeruginosa]CCH99245.1 membrane hypothetical protein [Microcystis aeruginosa PCC 9717]